MPAASGPRVAGSDERLRKLDRVRRADDFRRISRQGRRLRGSDFTLVAAPGQVGLTRLGITVSRQVGKAHDRNRLRRLIREYFRRNRALFPPDHDVVIVPKAGIGWRRLADLAEIGQLLRRLRDPGSRPRRSSG